MWTDFGLKENAKPKLEQSVNPHPDYQTNLDYARKRVEEHEKRLKLISNKDLIGKVEGAKDIEFEPNSFAYRSRGIDNQMQLKIGGSQHMDDCILWFYVEKAYGSLVRPIFMWQSHYAFKKECVETWNAFQDALKLHAKLKMPDFKEGFGLVHWKRDKEYGLKSF